LAVTETVFETVTPLLGAVIETVGGVVSVVVLSTVTDTEALVVEFPAVSVATAVKTWAPFESNFVSSGYAYGGAMTALPVFVPSALNWTLATATLSVAFAVRLTLPERVAFALGDVIVMLGGVVSVVDVVLLLELPL